jgi:hypothetical protein
MTITPSMSHARAPCRGSPIVAASLVAPMVGGRHARCMVRLPRGAMSPRLFPQGYEGEMRASTPAVPLCAPHQGRRGGCCGNRHHQNRWRSSKARKRATPLALRRCLPPRHLWNHPVHKHRRGGAPPTLMMRREFLIMAPHTSHSVSMSLLYLHRLCVTIK